MFEGKGILYYSESGWVWLVPLLDIGDYYHDWVRRATYKKYNKPRDGYHVTVVAGKYEDVRSHPAWKKRDNDIITFQYTPEELLDDQTTFWLTVHSRELEEIRLELDLYPFPRWPFHITVANLKNL